jgi:hypothetical protein
MIPFGSKENEVWSMLPGRVLPFAERVDACSEATERFRIVIQVGRDRELLRLRARIIKSAGHSVHSVTPDEAVAEVQKARAAQVWVFCHTIEFYELALLAVAIRQRRPADKLLRLAGLNDPGQPPGLFDELLEPVEGVDDLLRVVAELARKTGLETEQI